MIYVDDLKLQAYFGAGGENPESFYRAFSNEILEAAFNVSKRSISAGVV